MSIIVICGATATGKSGLSIELAQRLDGEIINADSMQIYKGMDVGTAKLNIEERSGITHHMLDILDVNQDATVAWYQEEARKCVDDIVSRSKTAIIVGGTGLYIKSILDDLNFPDTDPDVRSALNKEAEDIGAAALFDRLKKLDPAAAIAIDSLNVRRVIRALEVIEITGKPFTANLPHENSTRYPHAMQFGLVLDRQLLSEKISLRVDQMFEQGLINEVDDLLEAGLTQGRTAQRALGYAQVIKYRSGAISLDEAIEETKRVTRQYARRQETWFSRDARIKWISPIQNRVQVVLNALASK